MSTAGVVVIGDEILSGKTADTNTPFLIDELRGLGVLLRRIAVVPDQLDEVADTVRLFAASFDHVFTSGGIGPTHDDVTVAAVARAFGVPIQREPALERMMRAHYERAPAGSEQALLRNLRMADLPAGATLLYDGNLTWPVLAVRNVYVLPGIPELFRRKFLAIRERFRCAPFHLRQLFVREEEGAIAPHLDRIAAGYPRVALGSYPRFTPSPEDGHRVKLTLEGKDVADVDRACEELAALLGPQSVTRRA